MWTRPHVHMPTGAPWARATKNVKKPLGEKGRTFRKSKMLCGVHNRKLLLFHSIKTHIYDNHINLRFLYIFCENGLLCAVHGEARGRGRARFLVPALPAARALALVGRCHFCNNTVGGARPCMSYAADWDGAAVLWPSTSVAYTAIASSYTTSFTFWKKI